MENKIKELEEKLLRKEQECEKYKTRSESLQNIADGLQKRNHFLTLDNERLEQECEELKAYAQRQENQREEYYKEYLKLSQECEELQNELDLYKTWYRAKHDDVKNYLGRYRKALDEIEVICIYGAYDEFEMPLDECSVILNIINKARGEGNE